MKKDYRSEPFGCMVAMGDSITRGAKASKSERSWVNILAKYISGYQGGGLKVVNAGIDGNLISKRSPAYYHEDSGKPGAFERYEEDVLAHEPDLIILALGLNDVRCGTLAETFIEDLEEIIKAVRKVTSSVIVIVNVYYMTGFKKHGSIWAHADINKILMYNERMEKCAEENGLLYADVFSAMGYADRLIDEDGVHPNDLGHLLIANKVFETIATSDSFYSMEVRNKMKRQI